LLPAQRTTPTPLDDFTSGKTHAVLRLYPIFHSSKGNPLLSDYALTITLDYYNLRGVRILSLFQNLLLIRFDLCFSRVEGRMQSPPLPSAISIQEISVCVPPPSWVLSRLSSRSWFLFDFYTPVRTPPFVIEKYCFPPFFVCASSVQFSPFFKSLYTQGVEDVPESLSRIVPFSCSSSNIKGFFVDCSHLQYFTETPLHLLLSYDSPTP